MLWVIIGADMAVHGVGLQLTKYYRLVNFRVSLRTTLMYYCFAFHNHNHNERYSHLETEQ